jgi:hypothetical protein
MRDHPARNIHTTALLNKLPLKHAMTQFLVLCYWGRAGLDGTSAPERKEKRNTVKLNFIRIIIRIDAT